MAYCLGQIHNVAALPILERVLSDETEHTMVRHEVSWHCSDRHIEKHGKLTPVLLCNQAAEAMGAISDPSSLPILRQYLTHTDRALRETAEIAVAKIEWDNSEEGKRTAVAK